MFLQYENEIHQNGSKSTECLGRKRKQESLLRVSRSSFSSDPDGKVQDPSACSKVSEDVSGSPLVHVKNGKAASTVLDGSGDHVASQTLDVVHSSEPPGENYRNVTDPTARDYQEDSSVPLVSCNRKLKSFPSTRCLENSENHESPFRKLYVSMKEEFDVRSEKRNVLQSSKKSGSQSHPAPENECSGGLQEGTQVPVSLKSRPRSGRFTQIKADSALGKQGISQTEDRRNDEDAAPNPKEAMSPSIPPKEMTRAKTLAQRSPHSSSRKRRSEDMSVTSGSESMNLDQREGFGTENETFTPRKFLARNQTPAKVENADDFEDTPEKLFSKKRRSVPPSVDILTAETETQNHTILAPLPVQVERKIQGVSVHQPEKVGATAGHTCSGLPGHSSVDTSNFGDSNNKIEGIPLKRRRVSFGGRLKPELFDENLPPNTPLKRGETPRRSLVSHTPPVLKKIIKECPPPSGKEDSSENQLEVTAQPQRKGSPARDPTQTSPVATDTRRRSCKVASVPGRSKSPHLTDIPKRGGRRSGNLPSKRTSIDRSQHEILQMIYSRRRSGASEANLIVAKSWADVVKLGAKQTQAKVVKHGPQRQLNKRQRRMNTPKKPVSNVHNQFSTGHANSPCTIIIGKAHIEKVNVPTRPYRMLNNFVFNKKMDFNEDLSGLTEMFKTPAKVKLQTMSLCPKTFSNSEDLLGKEFQVPNSGEKPLLCTSEDLGENVFSMSQNALQEPSNQSPASPALRRQAIRVNTNIEKTPGSGAEPRKSASNENRLRRSEELRNTRMPGVGPKDGEAETDIAESTSGRRLTKTPQRGRNLEGATEEWESYSEACTKAVQSEENSAKMVAVRRSRRYSEQKWEPVADLTTLTGWEDPEPKKDLRGIHGLQTPTHTQEPMDVGNKTAEKCQKSSKPEVAGMPTRMSIQLKTSPQRVEREEEPSALRKPTRTPRESTHTQRESGGGDEDIKLFKGTPKWKLDSAEDITRSKRRSRTSKKTAQSLEDLADLRELFQTPNHKDKSMADGKATKVPCRSPLAEPVNTPTSRRRQLETPLQKVDLEEEPSALRKPTQTPRESTPSHRKPGNGDEGIKLFKETPKQKLDSAAYVTGSKKRSRTPKKMVHSPEDVVGLKELFQTPEHTQYPMADDRTTKIPCKSPLAEPVNTPTSGRRQIKTPLQKVDPEEEPSALRKPTQTPRESTHSHGEPGGDDEGIKLFNQTPKQKLDSAENVTGSKKRSRTPKKNIQSLEDLAGLRELFKTPNQREKPMTDDKTTKVPCKSPLADPVNTPTIRKRQIKTPLQKVGLEEEPSAFRKPTQTPRESTHSHREPGDGDDEDIKLFNQTPKQKLDFAEIVTGSKRRSRTPKKTAQSLEDLVGLRELLQTPNQTDKPVADDKTTKVPRRSPLADPVNTPSRRRQIKTPLQKVGLEEEPSALRKPTQMLGENTHSHKEPGVDDECIKRFKDTPKQKLNSAENVTGSKRKKRSRTPKKNIQSLEDLAGLRELFKTPNQTEKPMTDDKTTKVPCKSPLADPVNTPTIRKRQIKTPLQKVGLEEEPSAFRKPTQTPRESTHSHREPGDGDGEDIKLFNQTPKQKLDFAEIVTGSKKRSRTPKKTAQSLEDLVGLRELLQTPNQTDKPVADDKTTKVPCRSPLAEPVNTPSRRRQIKTPLQKVGLEEEPSALRKPTQMLGENTHSHEEPGGDDEGIKRFKDTPKQKLNSAENVTGSKRKKRSRTPKKNIQSLEDLAGLRELFKTPNQTEKPMTDDKTTKVPCKSPLADPVNTPTIRKRQIKTPLQKVGLEEEPSAFRKPTQTPRESTHSHREPGDGDGEDIKLFNQTPEQKLDFAEIVTGSKKRSRTPKKTAQSLEDLVGLRELLQTPNQTDKLVADDKTTKVPCRSPLAEPVNTPNRRRQIKKVGLEEEPSALRKPTQMLGENTHSHEEPGGDDECIKRFKDTPKQKLHSAENVTRSKRRSRTPKKNIHSLEDLAGITELFQTPEHTQDPMTDGKTTNIPCKSPLAEPVNTPTSRRRQLEIPLQKLDLEEEPSALRRPTQTPRESTHSHREPRGDDEGIKLFNQTPKQKLDSAENVTGSKKRSRTPKKSIQSLEDLAGLGELLQTPNQTDKAMADGQATSVPCKSPLAEPVNTPTSRRRQLEFPLQKLDLEEEPSALRKPTQTPRESTPSHRKSGGDDKDSELFNQTPKQKLNSAENVTGSKKRSRTPKKDTQSLEDLAGLRELFQTPEHSQDPMADGKTTSEPCRSPVPDSVTPTIRRRQLETPLQEVDLEEKPSSLRKPTQMLGESTYSRRELGGGDDDIKLSKETPKKLDPVENVTRSKEGKAQFLEDMVGFKELFQTPELSKEPTAIVKATIMPCKSPPAETGSTPTHMKRYLQMPLGKEDLKKELSPVRKPILMPGEATHTEQDPGADDKDIRLFKKTPKQKLNLAENAPGSKKQPRTPKKMTHSLEDLVGLKELFQTPEHTQDPMADGKTTKMPCKSPITEPVNKPTGRRRQLNTFPQKVDVEEEPSALRKPTRTRRGATHSHTQPGGGDEDTKLSRAIPKQKLDSAENVTGSKRQPRAPKKNVQTLEDLAGLRELQTPEHTHDPMADGKATSVPCKSPVAEPVNKPTGRRRQLNTFPQKVDVEEEPSALRKPTRTRRGATHSHTEPGGGDEDTKLSTAIPKQKPDSAENVTGSKRQPRAPKKNVQTLEDLAGLRELQTPEHTHDPMADGKATSVPCKSLVAEPVKKPTGRRRCLKTSPEKVDPEEEPSALRKPTRTRRGATHSHTEPGGGDEDNKLLNKTTKQKAAPAENVMLRKNRLRAPKEKSQAPEDLAGSKESSQMPGHTKGLGDEASSIQETPKQTPDRRKPVKVLQRGVRAPRGKAVDDLVGQRDPLVESGSEGSVSLSSKRKQGMDGGQTGMKRLRSATSAQDTAEEKPPQKRRRTAPREGCDPPEQPLTVKKKLRVVAEKIEVMGDLPRSHREAEAKGQEVGRTTPPHQGRSLRSRRPNKTEVEEQRPEPVTAAACSREDENKEKRQEAPEDLPRDEATKPRRQSQEFCFWGQSTP
ncbi:proliferation marker protein Ki-67 isoform X2 [Vulpes lagopus]|uniref:proliferation marker protein Ki-67 isoform X2 n=1 Tax=Vulpes lagopus TaxID=494514 RepID=UPI001BC9BFC4|nr:proliferation marker protein Ki-67 isoform X2 [Vulpes lagopus]